MIASMAHHGSGPLAGIRVVELAGLGPAPHASMMLADLGADVVRIERPGGRELDLDGGGVITRHRRIVEADLKDPIERQQVMNLVALADVLVEGLRPGVTERLGMGPDDCNAVNPRLVYGRITGWGQDGPMAGDVGHDINYVGLTGALHAMGDEDRPPAPPLNLVGDFGGGSMLLLVGILSALVERERSGLGQVIDAAMVDGTALLTQLVLAMRPSGAWTDDRHANLLDGGAPFYSTYACSDGRFVAVGALESRFFADLASGLGLDPDTERTRWDRSTWPGLRADLSGRFGTQSRDEWVAHFAATEACVTPVLTFDEAAEHPHLAARATFTTVEGALQAAPAPRFSRTPGRDPADSRTASVDLATILADWVGGAHEAGI